MTCTDDVRNRQPNLLRGKSTPVLTPKANLNSMRKGFSLGLQLEISRLFGREKEDACTAISVTACYKSDFEERMFKRWAENQ
jgi:hypothetical protein